MHCMYSTYVSMMKEASCKQMHLDLLSTTNVHPSTKAAWETVALLLASPLPFPPGFRIQQPLVLRVATFHITYHIIMHSNLGVC